MNANTLPIGSWSHGTLRPEDLAEALILMANSVGIDGDPGIVIMGEADFDTLARYRDRQGFPLKVRLPLMYPRPALIR